MVKVKEDELFCVGQKAVILREKEILLLHDPMPPPGTIDLPGGKIQVGERDFTKALQREVYEESGLTIKVGPPFFVSFWKFARNHPHRNQGKKIFLVFYVCVYQSGAVELSEEHDWFRWTDKKSFPEIFNEKNNIFLAVSTYFRMMLDHKSFSFLK